MVIKSVKREKCRRNVKTTTVNNYGCFNADLIVLHLLKLIKIIFSEVFLRQLKQKKANTYVFSNFRIGN
jgi:hypothetical protein